MSTARLCLVLRPYSRLVSQHARTHYPRKYLPFHRSYHASERRQAAVEARPTRSQDLPSSTTVVLAAPTQHDLEEAELDVDLIQSEEARLEITDRAAEVSSVRRELSHSAEIYAQAPQVNFDSRE